MLTASFGMLGATSRMLGADIPMLGAGFEMLDAKMTGEKSVQLFIFTFFDHLIAAAVRALFVRFSFEKIGTKSLKAYAHSSIRPRSNFVSRMIAMSFSSSESVGGRLSRTDKPYRRHSRKIFMRSSGLFLGNAPRSHSSSPMGNRIFFGLAIYDFRVLSAECNPPSPGFSAREKIWAGRAE